MFKVTVELFVDSDLDEQVRAVAGKVHSAIQDRVKPGPCPVKWEIRAVKLTPSSPILRPDTPMLIQPPSNPHREKAIHGDSRLLG